MHVVAKPFRSPVVAVGLALLAAATAGCGSSSPNAQTVGAGKYVIHVAPSGCASGALHLSASPSSAAPGATVTLATTALPESDFVVESVGTIGHQNGGSYTPLWDITLATSGKTDSIDEQVTGTTAVTQNGVGISNPSFAIDVPPLSSGSYEIRFTYQIPPIPHMAAGLHPGSYTVCAPLKVT